MNISLYMLVVGLWGTTWLAIALQVKFAEVAPEISVFYRFLVAGCFQLIVMFLLRKLKWIPIAVQGWVFMLGMLLFCFNFLFFYNAVNYINSGLISVVFSMATLLNLLNRYLFYRQVPSVRMLVGAGFGLTGILFIFGGDLSSLVSRGVLGDGSGHDIEASQNILIGVGLSFLGTYCFSLGNLVSQKLQAMKYDVLSVNSYALFYGTFMLGVWNIFHGSDFSLPLDDIFYMGGLVYLAVPGTVIGFGAYLMLVGRIGPEKSAYATVLFPIVALCLSAIFEDFVWEKGSIIGVLFVLGGNVIIFMPKEYLAKRIIRQRKLS